MYPSDAYPYDIRDTSFKRDPMRELADACRKRGLRFGFYYSHAFDWEHPDAPGNDWDYNQPGGDKKLHGAEQWYDQHPEMLERAKKYVHVKAIPQLLELIKNYQPDILWFDTSGKLPFSEQIRIVEACRKADADVVINGRAARGVGRNWGDYTNTGDNPAEVRGTEGDWESIPTVNSSYGYHQHDVNFKTPEFFIQLIAKVAAKGGNTLLNLGPKGDGSIDADSERIFRGIGKWMAVNGESIWGTTRTPLDRQPWGDSTLKGTTLYLHVFTWPSDGKLVVGGLQTDVTSAYLLAEPEVKKSLKIERLNENDLVVHLHRSAPDPTNSVIVLECAGPVKAKDGFLLAANLPTNRLLAFDGVAKAKSVRYGDGKANRYYVAGLAAPEDSIAWKVRLNAPATFDVSLTYSTLSTEQTGTYALVAGDQKLAGGVKPTKNATTLEEVKLGQLQLPAGETQIHINPVEVRGDDLMNLFEINLKPAR
jgi:alpha-L-fucosidase